LGNSFNELRRQTWPLGTAVRLMNTDRETNYDKSFLVNYFINIGHVVRTTAV